MSGAFVPASGHSDSRWMLVVDGPNKEDISRRRLLSGKAGSELDRFFDNHHLPSRERWYTTSLLKVQPADKEPTEAEIAEGLPYFERELAQAAAEVIVTMGKRATSYFLGDKHGVDVIHGIPMRSERTKALVVCVPHPMHALLSPETYARFVKDMTALEMLLKGTLPEPPFDDGIADYRVVIGETGVARELGEWAGDIAIDTEGSTANPWSLQFTLYPGHGFVLLACDSYGLAAFAAHLVKHKNRIIFHHSLHDLAVCRVLGVDVLGVGCPIVDSMVDAYLLGEHQGLKALGLRLAGMEQDDYMELVAEPAEVMAREWLATLAWITYERNYGPKPNDLEKALRLVERMLLKDAKTTVRERWPDCRAREILQDELLLIGELPEPTLDMIPREKAVRYAGRDTDLTIRVAPVLEERIIALGLQRPRALDMGIVPMVERMQRVGMQVDVPYLHDLSTLLKDEFRITVEMIRERAGKDINPNSGPQVAEWLFDDLRLPWSKKTKGGQIVTDRKVLKTLAQNFNITAEGREAVKLVLEAKEITKVISFCDGIEEWLDADRRIHPQILLTRTGTGRSAAKDPNLLAFPKHTARGRLIRGGFVAGEGRMLGEWDLSQIDLRALAIDSGDEKMISQFNSGHDFHTAGAAGRYNIPIDAVTKPLRYSQKKVNFAIPMGTTKFGLCESFHQDGLLDQTPEDCQVLLDAWYADYAGATTYIHGKHAQARRFGYVTTWTGRMRYLEGVHSADKYAVSEALRQAQATPIQGGARDIVKMWLIAVWERMPEIWALGYWAEIILDIHDSILVEFDVDALPHMERIVKQALASIQEFVIPITMDYTTGSSWGDL